jgi:hypothetical protein
MNKKMKYTRDGYGAYRRREFRISAWMFFIGLVAIGVVLWIW